MKSYEPKLKEAAKTINSLIKAENDARRNLCIAIAGAMDLVKKAGLVWRDWADGNLRKPDGSKWSQWTLYSYASFGRNPEKLDHLRDSISKHGREARKALRAIPIVPVDNRSIEAEKELQWLLSAWKRCSPSTRRKFLKIIEKEMAA